MAESVTTDLNNVSAWQYDLPKELIASRPAKRRDDARLMVVSRRGPSISHHRMRELPDLLQSGDRLVFNDTRVLPARLFGRRTQTGGRWEGLFLNSQSDGCWRITGHTRGKLCAGESITLHPPRAAEPTLRLHLMQRNHDGSWICRPECDREITAVLDEFGTLPLPPYIGRPVADDQDRDRYQTVFAARPGAIAAPTAGLHFTPALFSGLDKRNIHRSAITLHVGIGTFQPVSTKNLSDHRIHSEWCELSNSVAADIRTTQSSGGRIVAVGTTCVRTLESTAATGGLLPFRGITDLFIRPGFEFRVVDQLLTNFHLPGSTLIVMVAALAGYDLILEAYRVAIAERYRFYSYGDAMLIL